MKIIIVGIFRYVSALLTTVYLFSFGFIFPKNRSLVSTISNYFGNKRLSFISILPKISLSAVVKDTVPIQLSEVETRDGNVSLIELICIANIVKQLNPSSVFEIGTFDGRSTLNIAINCAQEAKVYTLDLPKGMAHTTKFSLALGDEAYVNKNTSRLRVQSEDRVKKITQLFGDSGSYDFFPFYGTIDFVFVDGSHSYKYTLNDSIISLKLLRDHRSMIVWHDYGVWYGVTKALNELYSKGDSVFKKMKHIEGTSLVVLA